MVWYFIGVYIINRTSHGRLEIRNFCSRVEKNISLVHCIHSWNIFQHSKKNFVSPRGHVISSISTGWVLGKSIKLILCYPLDRDLSRGYHYPPFKQLESEGDPLRKVLGNWSSGLGVQVAHLSMTYNVGYSEGSKLGGGMVLFHVQILTIFTYHMLYKIIMTIISWLYSWLVGSFHESRI